MTGVERKTITITRAVGRKGYTFAEAGRVVFATKREAITTARLLGGRNATIVDKAR